MNRTLSSPLLRMDWVMLSTSFSERIGWLLTSRIMKPLGMPASANLPWRSTPVTITPLLMPSLLAVFSSNALKEAPSELKRALLYDAGGPFAIL